MCSRRNAGSCCARKRAAAHQAQGHSRHVVQHGRAAFVRHERHQHGEQSRGETGVADGQRHQRQGMLPVNAKNQAAAAEHHPAAQQQHHHREHDLAGEEWHQRIPHRLVSLEGALPQFAVEIAHRVAGEKQQKHRRTTRSADRRTCCRWHRSSIRLLCQRFSTRDLGRRCPSSRVGPHF